MIYATDGSMHGCAVVVYDDKHRKLENIHCIMTEHGVQRNELCALRLALHIIQRNTDGCATIVTDSQYCARMIQNDWPTTWKANNWITSQGTVVANLDVVKDILKIVDALHKQNIYVVVLDIPGHILGKYHSLYCTSSIQEAREALLTQNVPVNMKRFNELLETTTLADGLLYARLNNLADCYCYAKAPGNNATTVAL